MAKTPTQRTLAELRKRGYVCDIVERWLGGVRRGDGGFGIRKDLFGVMDIIALDKMNLLILGVQSTGQDFAGHRRKLFTEKARVIDLWLQCGGVFELWGWRKVKRGNRQIWEPRIERISREEIALFI